MSFLRELRYAARIFVRAPGFSAAVIVTLGLGIGANAGVFSVLSGILLRPLPNRDEARLLYLRQSAAGIGQVDLDPLECLRPARRLDPEPVRLHRRPPFAEFSAATMPAARTCRKRST